MNPNRAGIPPELLWESHIEESLEENVGRQLAHDTDAILTDHVEDRTGQLHDLLIMSYDVEGFTSPLE